MKELVTIVVPVLNRIDKTRDCIRNLLEQTYKLIEIIIVDDGSSENIRNMIEEFADSRLIYIGYSENRGANHARNIGIINSSGKYISFQDSDDIWEKEKIQKQMDLIEKHQADLVFCQVKRQGFRLDSTTPEDDFVFEAKRFESDIQYRNYVSTQTMFIKRSVFSIVGLFDEEIPRYQDWEFIIRAASKIKIDYIKETLVYSEVQHDSITLSSKKEMVALRKIYKKNQKIFKFLPKMKLVVRMLRNSIDQVKSSKNAI